MWLKNSHQNFPFLRRSIRHRSVTKSSTFPSCITTNWISFTTCKIIKWDSSATRSRPLTSGSINKRQPSPTWWPIKHINCNRRTIPIIITCLVRISKCCWCNRQVRIRIINSNSSNHKCRRNWPPAEIITSDNRHPKRRAATRTDPRATTATTTHSTIQMWVLSMLCKWKSKSFAILSNTLQS